MCSSDLRVSMPNVVIVAELPSRPTRRFTMFSELERPPHDIDYSGMSGGPIFWTPTAEGLADVGKVVYWAHQGKFRPPRHSRFIAPKGPSGPLRTLLDNPSLLKFSTAGSNTVLGK